MESTITITWVETCLLSALFLPLISAILSLIISKRYSWAITFTAPFLLLLSAVSACMVFFSGLNAHTTYSMPVEWFIVGSYHFSAGIELDYQSIIMLPVVTVISFLVHLYSMGYMAGDTGIKRYFAVLGFFTSAMLGIVLADNLLLIFVFWELVGFSSYILIGHWMEKPEAAQAAKKAFIFNRVGDLGFLIGLMLVWTNAGTFNVGDLLYHSETYSWQTAASLCLFGGVIGKSAQFPLLTWLPDAMEGPTPVSALIHAATMVAAGVFLLIKLFLLFTPEALNVVAIVGATTSLMAAFSALVQYDIKKILAYSTISQLGLMVMAVGTGSEAAAMTHLFTHAFFKAGLFLGAGAVIHSLHQLEQQTQHHLDVQDIRNLGGLKKHLPITFITFILCGAALAGLPFSSGFLSKDAILSGLWGWTGSAISWRWIIGVVAFLIPFLTVLYTFRMTWFVFFGENRTEKITGVSLKLTEVPAVMRLPLIALSVCSLWFVLSLNPFDFSGWLYNSLVTGKEFHFPFITIFSSLWSLTALAIAYFYFTTRVLGKDSSYITRLVSQSFFLDELYHTIFGKPIQKISLLAERIDLKWIDGLIHLGVYAQVTMAHFLAWIDRTLIDGTVNGMARMAGGVGTFTRSFQSGKIQLYIFWAILGMIIFLIWTLL